MALCPQCPFSSRSPSDVDEHMASVHRDSIEVESEAVPPPPAISTSSALNLPVPQFFESNPSLQINNLPPQISALVSIAQSLAGSMPMPFANMSLPLSNTPNHSSTRNISNEEPQSVRIPDIPENMPCSSRSMENNNTTRRKDSRRRYK